MRFEAFICDLDNTLYDENIFLKAICESFCHRYGCDIQLINTILDDNFRLHSKDIFGDWLKSFDFYTSQKQEELFSLYQSMPTSLQLYDDAKDFLNLLQTKNIKYGILTNGDIKAQSHKISLLGLKNIPIVYARAYGKEYEKPHISAFHRILEILQLSPQSCAFIGDNPTTDINGANNAGIYSIWLKRRYGRLIPCDYASLSITNFKELRELQI